MGIKSILCIFQGAQNELSAVNSALCLAKIFAAHVRFLHISHDPSTYGNLYDEGMFISIEMSAHIEEINKKKLDKAKQYVTSFCTSHEVSLNAENPPTHHAHAKFLHQIGEAEAIIAREGRLSDIIVISRGIEHDILYNEALFASLFNTGRQVLIMPVVTGHMQNNWEEKVISIAWDGSLEVARAIFNSVPLLERAEKVKVLTANDHEANGNIHFTTPLADYLTAHEIHAEYIAIDCKKRNAGEAILEKANDLQSNLLIMGACGHSHFREMIMGGFTKYMLEEADIPLLLSH